MVIRKHLGSIKALVALTGRPSCGRVEPNNARMQENVLSFGLLATRRIIGYTRGFTTVRFGSFIMKSYVAFGLKVERAG